MYLGQVWTIRLPQFVTPENIMDMGVILATIVHISVSRASWDPTDRDTQHHLNGVAKGKLTCSHMAYFRFIPERKIDCAEQTRRE